MMLRFFLRAMDRLRARLRARQWADHEAVGRSGEDLAHRFLERAGLTVIARNWRPPGTAHGEIDLIALAGEVRVFVEVKTRREGVEAAPDRAINGEKMRSWRYMARTYLRRTDSPGALCRMDLISVVLEPELRIEHVPDAFSLR
jgi:putative endonuclease